MAKTIAERFWSKVTNVLRSPYTAGSVNAVKTHCPSNHEYDEANTRITVRGTRLCRECKRIKARAEYHQAKAARR